MSSPKEDRKIQSVSGKRFQSRSHDGRGGSLRFAEAIAAALRLEYGGSHGAVKTVVELTGANERVVKNWFQAKNGPSGEFLIALCRHSDHVLETVLLMAGREEQVKAKKFIDAKAKLRQMLTLMDELQGK